MPHTQDDQRMTKAQLAGWMEQEQQKQREQCKRRNQRPTTCEQLTEWMEQEQQKQTKQGACDAFLLRKAKSRALYILEASDKTEKQLREKLDKNYPPHITEQVIAYVKDLHYIDDLRYAKRYIESRSTVKSKRVVCMELQAKGISREILEEVEDAFSEETQETLVLQLAEQQFRKRKLDVANAPREEVQKVYQFLLRRGFSYQEAQKAVCTLRDAADVREMELF